MTKNSTQLSKRDLAKNKGSFMDRIAFYLMLLPGIIFICAFQYLPKFGMILAFKNFRYDKGIFGSEWCGLENFEYFFRTPDAWIITRNTLLYNILFIFLNLVLAVSMAIALNEIVSKFATKVYQTIALMPHFLSYVIVSYLVYAMLATDTGFVNRGLMPALGLEQVNWYSEAKYWPYILTFVKQWKGVGYGSIVYLAAIAGINPEYYEAAQIDGATKWQQIIHVTIPGIRGMMSIMTIMAFGGIFNADFGLFYQVPMNSGLLRSTTSVLATYIYNSMGDVGFSTAAGMYVSVVGLAMILLTNAIANKLDPDSALF